MKKRTSKKDIVLGLILFLGLSLLSIVSALGTQLACLEEGQRIYFSDCNPSIDDYICDSQSCQLCVNEVRSGIYCPASINDCNEIGGGCTQVIDEPIETPEVNPDVIVLISPENDFSTDEAGNITFSFKVTAYRFEKCELILDGDIAAIKSRPIYRDRQYDLTYFVEEGEHTWRIDCTEVEIDGGDLILSETRNLLVGSGSRNNEITLISPEADFTTTEGNINFIFNVSDSLAEITQCNLNLNEQTFAISPVNAENTITQSVAAGSYTWSVECLSTQDSISSESRSFTINSAAPAPNTGGGGGGGGGGGSSGGGGGSSGGCTTTWNCTAWSSCVNGKQTRTCSKEKTYCYAPATETTRNCSQVSSTSGNENSEESNEESTEAQVSSQNIFQRGIAGITGAAIGVGGTLKDNKIPVIIILAVLIGSLSVYIYRKKKK